jgi:DNA-binding transcriptional MerR regulator
LTRTGLTLPELAEVADVEYRTLHTWVKRGLVEPSVRRSAGTGTANLFSGTDAVAARVLADLRRAGLSMATLERASEALRENDRLLDRPGVLLVNGKVEVFSNTTSAAAALDRPGVSLVYRTREALERVAAALPTD